MTMQDEQEPTFLTAEDLARRWNGAISAHAIKAWRRAGSQTSGPPFIRFTQKVVLYPLDAVIAWERARMKFC